MEKVEKVILQAHRKLDKVGGLNFLKVTVNSEKFKIRKATFNNLEKLEQLDNY